MTTPITPTVLAVTPYGVAYSPFTVLESELDVLKAGLDALQTQAAMLVVKGSLVCNVKDYGAVGNGVTDDAASIQAALSEGGTTYFPSGTYLIKSALTLRDGCFLQGNPLSSTILLDSTFVAGGSPPYTVGAISNEHYSVSYDDATADSIEIHGIRFHHSGTGQIPATLWFGNIKHLVIDGCDFLTDAIVTGTYTHTQIYLYASYKHVWITNNRMKHECGVLHGLCLLAQNFCGAAGATSVCEDIHVTGNYMSTNCGDEAFNACGENGVFRNATIAHNTFEHVAGGTAAYRFVSIFGSISTPTAYSMVENVAFDNNNFLVDDFTVDVIGLGRTTDTTPMRNISVDDNMILCAAATTGVTRVINKQSAIDNLSVNDNKIYNTGVTAIAVAIYNVGVVEDNIIYGAFSQGITYPDRADGNKITLTSAGIGVYDGTSVTNNTILGAGQGVLCDVTANYSVKNNRIVLAAGTRYCIYGQSVASSAPALTIVGNTLETIAGGQYAILLAGAGVPRIALNNWINGGGTYSSLATANAWTVADG